MKFQDKLKKTRRNAMIAGIVAVFTAIYFLVSASKGLYFWTMDSRFTLIKSINSGLHWFIEKTYVFPISFAWDKIPFIPFEDSDIISFYKVVAPPIIIWGVCCFFINNHRFLKRKYYQLKTKIENEMALRDMRKETELENVPKNVAIEILISNAIHSEKSWDNRWWGKIIIGIAVVLIAVALGLK